MNGNPISDYPFITAYSAATSGSIEFDPDSNELAGEYEVEVIVTDNDTALTGIIHTTSLFFTVIV